MRIGVAFPTTEIGTDPAVIRAFAKAAEELGYDHITLIDHVLQSGTAEADDWRAYYTRDNMFHEPMVLFGFLAAATQRIELATAILILPQRPTVLVAKQAAQIDVLTGGRLRLGVGIGWNRLEFDALGQNFRNRARRIEEQVSVLRALWTNELVTYEGEWHRIEDAGINPLPVQQPIPIWFGAFEDPAIRRAGRLADGWYLNPRVGPDDEAKRQIEISHESARDEGRDPAALGIDTTLHIGAEGPQAWAARVEEWRALGASHVTLRTMYAGLETPDDHIDAMRRFREACPVG
ncbi:MAG: LLM class F420-dependent oxidoreductase [Alphaproteobacteria bacterium]|nr:LLM class F420-dependent oxidoreductase [Alphaproteobacteria bacterium]